MTELVELNNKKHSNYKVASNSRIDFASSQHLLQVRVAEIGHVVCSLPVFLSKSPQQGNWQLSALSSFQLGSNLLVQDGQWTVPYQPTSIQTYPLYLMNSPTEKRAYTIGIDEKSDAFSTTQGDMLFDNSGKATQTLSRIKTLLESDIEHDYNTYSFGKMLDELGLSKSINLLVRYQDDSTQKITGLMTIDEDKLRLLSPSTLETLNKKNYLAAIHAMLISILQLNTLIQKNNAQAHFPAIKNITIEVNK